MTTDESSSSHDAEDESHHSSLANGTAIHNGSPMMSRMEKPAKANGAYTQERFLSAPFVTGPIRPLSPDTLSNLSLDEYETLSRTFSRGPANPSSIDPSVPVRTGIRGRLDRFWIRNKGVLYMLLGQVFGVLMNVTTRLLEVEGNKGKGLHPFQILFARMSITFVLATTYMWYTKTPDFPFGRREVRLLLVARGLLGFLGVSGMYWSLLYLPLADATVITFLAPALACIACAILLKQPFTRVEQIGALVSLLGVVLIARPTSLFAGLSHGDSVTAPQNEGMQPGNGTAPAESDASSYANVTPMQRLTAVGVALIGVLGSAMVYTILRWIGKRAHPLISVNYFAGWCFLVSTVAQSVLPDVGWILPADLKEWGYLIFLGVCGFVMQFLLAAGLAYEKSSRATNMIYTSMIFALIADKVLFGHTPGIMSILGSSLILGSAITVAAQQDSGSTQRKENPEPGGDDAESRVGLIDGMQSTETAPARDQIPLQEVQLRTFR